MTRHIYGVCKNEDCPVCSNEAETRRDGDDIPESDRGQRADEQAEREERVRDKWWGGYAC